MNITIARPRCTRPVYAVVFDGVNRNRHHDWPISLSTPRGGDNLGFTLLVHFFANGKKGDLDEVIGTIVLPLERLFGLLGAQLSEPITQKLWMSIGDKFVNDLPSRSEANKYFDRLISEDDTSDAIRLPIFYSNDFKWLKEADGVHGQRRSTPSNSRRVQNTDRFTEKNDGGNFTPHLRTSPQKPPSKSAFEPLEDSIATKTYTNRSRNQIILRYCELMHGILVLRCFQAWAYFWLEEKRGLQAMQLFSELETKQSLLGEQEKEHEVAVRTAVQNGIRRHSEVLNLWKQAAMKNFVQEEKQWLRDVFTVWKRETALHVYSYQGTILWRWAKLVQVAFQDHFIRLISASSLRLKDNVRRYTKRAHRNALIVRVCFRLWEGIKTRRGQVLLAVRSVALKLHRKTNSICSFQAFLAWREFVEEQRTSRDLEKEKLNIKKARRTRAEYFRAMLDNQETICLRHIVSGWHAWQRHNKLTRAMEKMTEDCEEARKEAGAHKLETGDLKEKLEVIEKEMNTSLESFNATVASQDESHKTLFAMYEKAQKELEGLRGTDDALEVLRKTSTAETFQYQESLAESRAALEEANLEKEKLLYRITEAELELESEMQEEVSSRQTVKELLKKLERQNRKYIVLKQQTTNSLAEKDAEIAKLNVLREKENISAQQRLQKGAHHSRTLQKKLSSASNNAFYESRLEMAENLRQEADRKLAIADRELRRIQQLNATRTKEVEALKKECEETKALLEKSKEKIDPMNKARMRKKAEELTQKEEDELAKIKLELEVVTRENEGLKLDCGREEFLQKLKQKEIELISAEMPRKGI